MAQDSNNYWEHLERLEKLIKASELKAGVIFSFHSLILGIYVERIERFKDVILESTVLIVLLVCWVIFVAISIFYSFKCFKPSIEMNYEKNVFFFRDAVNKFGNIEGFAKELIKSCGSEKRLYKLLAEQIHAESKIINAKFRNVQKSIMFFGISFLFLIISSVFWIFFI